MIIHLTLFCLLIDSVYSTIYFQGHNAIHESYMTGPHYSYIEAYVCNFKNVEFCSQFQYIGIGHDESSIQLFKNNAIALIVDKNSTLSQEYNIPVLGIDSRYIDYGIAQTMPFYARIYKHSYLSAYMICGTILLTCGLYNIMNYVNESCKYKDLKTIRYKENLLNSNCTICLEDFNIDEKVVKVEECRHVFHKDCFKAWIDTKKTCPNCQQEISI